MPSTRNLQITLHPSTCIEDFRSKDIFEKGTIRYRKKSLAWYGKQWHPLQIPPPMKSSFYLSRTQTKNMSLISKSEFTHLSRHSEEPWTSKWPDALATRSLRESCVNKQRPSLYSYKVIRSPVVYTRATHFKNLGITGTPYPSLKFRLEIVGFLTLDPRRFILGSKMQIFNYVKV